ncbi:MAG: tyrosine-type recombinase/integrase [Clostridia bacterium]|nr:tyrosine-type recombinase/integrase [Clostridia bacterium]
MAIEKRGKGSWRLTLSVQGPSGPMLIRETVRVDPSLSEARQRREAEKAYALLLLRFDAGEVAPPRPAHTLRSWAETWLSTCIAPNCSPVTLKNDRHLLDSRILPELGDLKLTQLTPAVLTEWLAGLRDAPRKSTALPDAQLARGHRAPSDQLAPAEKRTRPLSANTVLHYYVCLSSCLEQAVRLELLKSNPMDRVPRPKLRKPKVRYLTEKQCVDLLTALCRDQNVAFRAAVLLALLCGLRLGEVGALRLSDVDFDAGTIDISRALKYTPARGSFEADPKSDAGDRLITLPAAVLSLLTQIRDYQAACCRLIPNLWRGEGWIVCAWDGAQLHHDTPSKWFRAFADRNGFEGLRFHDLRHTHASILLANGIDVVAVAARMGHEDPSVTLRTYAHALARRDKDSARVFDALLQDVSLPSVTPPSPVPAASPSPDPPRRP